jgi:hypothetical protein
MPFGDRSGPGGMGPMTGRRRGFCAGFDVPGYMTPEFGRGVGRGFVRGRDFGFRQRFYPQPIQSQVITEVDEKKILEAERKEIEKRLKELKSK